MPAPTATRRTRVARLLPRHRRPRDRARRRPRPGGAGGPFAGTRGRARGCLRWQSPRTLDVVDADHDAYARLADPVTHRRRVIFVKPRYWIIVDDLDGAAGARGRAEIPVRADRRRGGPGAPGPRAAPSARACSSTRSRRRRSPPRSSPGERPSGRLDLARLRPAPARAAPHLSRDRSASAADRDAPAPVEPAAVPRPPSPSGIPRAR